MTRYRAFLLPVMFGTRCARAFRIVRHSRLRVQASPAHHDTSSLYARNCVCSDDWFHFPYDTQLRVLSVIAACSPTSGVASCMYQRRYRNDEHHTSSQTPPLAANFNQTMYRGRTVVIEQPHTRLRLGMNAYRLTASMYVLLSFDLMSCDS